MCIDIKTRAPFEDTGLDMLGPLPCKMQGRATHKVWVALFCCMKTRSVHAELVYKMDANALVTQFTARQPGIKTFTSDNGSNLTKADKILKEQLREWNGSSTRELQRRGKSWTFIPPRAPHRGGCWERLMGIFKKHITAQNIKEPLHVDALGTLIIKIEAIVNKRPITALNGPKRL